MSGMLNKRCLLPLKLGVIAGMIVGYFHVKWIVAYFDYLRFHLYNTTAKLVTVEIDRWVVIIAAVLYAVWFVYLAGKRLKGKIRIAYWAIITSALSYYLCDKYDFLYRVREINAIFFRAAYTDSKAQLFAAALIIIGSLGYFGLKWARTRRRKLDESSEPSVNTIDVMKSCVVGFERQSWLFAAIFVMFLGLNLVTGFFWARAKISSRSKPNVIIIMVDTLRSDHVGCYGYSRNDTPNIDRFANGSIRFSRAIANSSWTTASVSSFMSSQLPQTTLAEARGNRVYVAKTSDPNSSISPRCCTIAEKLNDEEYVTAGITSNPQYSAERNAGQGFDYFDGSNVDKEISSPGVLSVADKWLDHNQDKRFFLFTLFMDTHSPYRKHSGYDFDPNYIGKDADKVDVSGSVNTKGATTKHMKDLYDSGIAYTDHHVGLLIDSLKKRKLYDKSLIIFIADHGEELRDHGGVFHGLTLYNELVSVPLIVKLPNQTQGRVVRGTFPLIDLFPTILEVLNLNPSSIHAQGKASDLDNVREMRDNYIFAQTNLNTVDLRSVQNRQYKYVLNMKSGHGMLFDIIKDPLEKCNILRENRGLAASLRKIVIEKDKEVRPDPESLADVTPVRRVTVMSHERMRSLGYVQ